MEQVVGGWRKGPWTPQEDKLLIHYITHNGEGRWSSVSKCTGLKRSGKSCRLRWVNYLRPGLKKGHLTPQEEGIIIELHALWGNKWSTIAKYLPGRTDNDIKNYWRTHFKTRKQQNIFKHIQGKESETDLNGFSESSAETENSTKDEETVMNNHQLMPSVYQESDLIPMDCYNLWEGLWNLNDDDDLRHVCNQMPVDPKQPINVSNCYHPFQGDAVDYVQPRSGDFYL